MSTTVEENGQGEDACVDQVVEATSILNQARKLCSDLATHLEGELDNYQFTGNRISDDGRIKKIQELMKETRTTLNTVLTVRAKLLSSLDVNQMKTGLVDLDEARAEISRQLARLAA